MLFFSRNESKKKFNQLALVKINLQMNEFFEVGASTSWHNLLGGRARSAPAHISPCLPTTSVPFTWAQSQRLRAQHSPLTHQITNTGTTTTTKTSTTVSVFGLAFFVF